MKTIIQANFKVDDVKKVLSSFSGKLKGGHVSTLLDRPVLIDIYKTRSACLIKLKKI